MQTIKKYANRKLYHTNRKQYITLEGIAELIQGGEPVQVVDNESGEDITAQILAQVVLQARGRRTSLPTHMLTDLIQAGGDKLAGLGRSVWTVLGGTSALDAEIKQRIQRLLEAGTIDEAESARMEHLLISNGTEPHPSSTLANVPSASDVARLNVQVDALTAVVEQLLADREHVAGPGERESLRRASQAAKPQEDTEQAT